MGMSRTDFGGMGVFRQCSLKVTAGHLVNNATLFVLAVQLIKSLPDLTPHGNTCRRSIPVKLAQVQPHLKLALRPTP